MSFISDHISSDDLLLLLCEFENSFHLIENISKFIDNKLDFWYIDLTIKKFFIRRIYQIATGYENMFDCMELHRVTIFKMSQIIYFQGK